MEMGEKRESSAELLQIIRVATRECTSILEAQSLTSHSVCDVHSDFPSREYSVDKGEKRNLTVQTPGQHRLSPVIRANISRLVERMRFDTAW